MLMCNSYPREQVGAPGPKLSCIAQFCLQRWPTAVPARSRESQGRGVWGGWGVALM